MNPNDNKPQGPQASAAALFGTGVQYVPGLGYVGPQVPKNGVGALGDDASVMMISGVGAADDQRNYVVDEQGKVQSVTGAGFKLTVALKQPVTIGSVTLPLWAWLLVGAGVLSVGAYFLLFKKK